MSKRRAHGALIALGSVLLVAPATAGAERWEIVSGDDRTRVEFHSKATVESFDGATRQIEGWVEFDPEAPAASIAWDVSVDLRSLDTGIGLRNQHMRENHLHTDQHPRAVFRGQVSQAAAGIALRAGESLHLELVGELELHGVTRPRTIPVELLPLADGSLEVRAWFTVSLAEHEIPRPKFLLLKLADLQQVEVRILARRTGGES